MTPGNVLRGAQETVFMSTGDAGEVFRSDHVEARVPAADVRARCHVTVQPPGAARATLPLGPPAQLSFRCHYHYRHEEITLSPVS